MRDGRLGRRPPRVPLRPGRRPPRGPHSAFGETTQSGETFPYAFTGRRHLGELGLYDYRSRFYHPWLSRFLQSDPIGIWGDGVGLGNGYAYAGNNPISRLDPFGLQGEGQGTAPESPGRTGVVPPPPPKPEAPDPEKDRKPERDCGRKRFLDGLPVPRILLEYQGRLVREVDSDNLVPYLKTLDALRRNDSLGAISAIWSAEAEHGFDLAGILEAIGRAAQFLTGAAELAAGATTAFAGLSLGWTGLGIGGVALGALTAARGVDNVIGALFRGGHTVVGDTAASVFGEGAAP
ncbi:MAG: RHS repeat-associated core domain-containing protein [Planctomycetota bacterium]